MAKKKKRRNANVKEQAVMRLFRGEDMELVSREIGCTMHELKQWRDKYMLAGKENLKSHPKDTRDAKLEQRDQLIASVKKRQGRQVSYFQWILSAGCFRWPSRPITIISGNRNRRLKDVKVGVLAPRFKSMTSSYW